MGSTKSAAKAAFAVNDTIVYPAHGVGRISAIEEQEIAGYKLELFVLEFAREKMVIRLPRSKVPTSGLRKVIDAAAAEGILEMLGGKARRSRALWSRRAQEYEGKINSGDVTSVAEVVRDLHRTGGEPASYSERNIYESAIARLVGELSVALDKSETEATSLINARLDQRVRPGQDAEEDEASTAAAA